MNKKTLLLIDDDVVIRVIIKSALENEYCVLEASGYSEAIKLLRYPIDLVIIDYTLPEHNVFKVLKVLQEVDPSMPAIIMTGYNNEDVVISSIRKEVAAYIKKPVNLAYLRKRLQEIFSDFGNSGNPEISGTKEFVFNAIANHIEEKYMKELTLDKLARMACMSKFSFCRAFKERFGQTFISYLNSIRIKNAVKLLENSHYSIMEIVYFVGYRNYGHFNRVFRAIHKVSPGEYRKKAAYLYTGEKIRKAVPAKERSPGKMTFH